MKPKPPSVTLSEDARSALAAVLDCLIPPSPDGRLPGAGALGLVQYVEERLGDAAALLASGLDLLDARAAERGATRFAALGPDARQEVLRAHAEADPGFVPGLVFHVFAGYYQRPEVLEALGMPGRPPHPLGYTVDPDDPSLLDPVRHRPPLYRTP